VPDETTHRYTLTVELDDRAEADLAVLAEYSGRSKEAVLREALLDGLETMKVIHDGDLAPPDPRPGSGDLDDGIPF
jgi:plasmid stability protein